MVITARERFLKAFKGEMPYRGPLTLSVVEQGHFINQMYPVLDLQDYLNEIPTHARDILETLHALRLCASYVFRKDHDIEPSSRISTNFLCGGYKLLSRLHIPCGIIGMDRQQTQYPSIARRREVM
jgi:hypothetical protein